jgi:hypothetical protein
MSDSLKALETNRLSEFIAQEHSRGIGPAESEELEAAIKLIATQQRPADQTSHPPCAGDSAGK